MFLKQRPIILYYALALVQGISCIPFPLVSEILTSKEFDVFVLVDKNIGKG